MSKYLLFFFFFGKFMFAQKTVITYYDKKKAKKKEVYQTDRKGINNGSYKIFDEAGELRNEGTYTAGKKNGIFTEYTKFADNTGKMQIKSKETFSNNVKEGIAVYFDYDADIGLYEVKKGQYKNDKQEGIWTQITPFSKVFAPEDYNTYKAIPAFKNSMGAKINITYKEGVELMPEGKQEVFYYPSNNSYHSYNLHNGKLIGKDIYLYPDGKAWSTMVYDDNNKYISSEAYYYNGKVKSKEIMEPYFYEGYNEDGSQNKVMGVKMNEASARKVNAEKLNTAIGEAKKMTSEGKTLQAINYLENAIKQYNEWKQYTFNYNGVIPEELQAAQDVLEKIKQPKK